MVSQARRDLEFFKVFLPQIASSEMVIPPAFTDILEKPLPKEVLLIDEMERSWCVETETEDTDKIYRVMFKKGWKSFVNDQSLEFGDFLVFSFDGDKRFSVTIFASDGCRKYLLGGIVTTTDKSRVSLDKQPITKPVETGAEAIEKEPADEDRLAEPKRRNRAKRKRKRDPVLKEEPSVLVEDEPVVNISSDSKTKPKENTRRKMIRAGDYCEKTWVSSDKKQERVVNPPENPHFVRTMTQSSFHRMEIPKTLLKSNGIDLEDDVELCDENGRKWPLKIATFDKGLKFAKASWLPFVKSRNWSKNSKCLFEFIVASNGSCREIKVRILHGRLRTKITKTGYEVLAM